MGQWASNNVNSKHVAGVTQISVQDEKEEIRMAGVPSRRRSLFLDTAANAQLSQLSTWDPQQLEGTV